MRGLAAELRGARDWMKVATAGEEGIRLYTCNVSQASARCQEHEHNQKQKHEHWHMSLTNKYHHQNNVCQGIVKRKSI